MQKKKIKNTKKALLHYWQQQFEFAKNPRVWLLSGLRLKRAADSIFKISKKAAVKEFETFVKSTENGTFKNGTRKLTSREIKLRLNSDLNHIYFLLAGFAIENILKGILISKNPQYINIKGINENLKTHNLVSLAQKCGLKINKKEKEILEKLTKDIRWRQRYPIPLELNKMISKNFGTGATNVVDAYFPNHAVIEKLFEKLTEELHNNPIQQIILAPK